MTEARAGKSPDDWMRLALSLAETAASMDEVPVGAVIVRGGEVIATGFNLRETLADPTEHAEMRAIRRASQVLGSWRLTDCELYVTLEPCLMCAGAIYQARIAKVFFGAFDPKAGANGSLYKVQKDARLNHNYVVEPQILAHSCGEILKAFFRAKRNLPPKERCPSG